jgi:hypothetical protein
VKEILLFGKLAGKGQGLFPLPFSSVRQHLPEQIEIPVFTQEVSGVNVALAPGFLRALDKLPVVEAGASLFC